MKIAFDISQTGATKAGCGYFAYALANELLAAGKTLDLSLLRTFGSAWWDPENEAIDFSGADAPARYAAGFADHGDATKFWTAKPDAIREALGCPDIIHANNFFSPPPISGTRQVYTLYDMTVFDCPQYTTESNRVVCMQGIMHAACNADALIAISEYTKSNFLDYFPFAEDRVTVVPLASRFSQASRSERPASVAAKSRFVLAVGTVEPRKNYDLLLQAFGLLSREADLTLIIAGRIGWNMDDFALTPTALGLGKRVKLLSYVSDEELAWLYANCVAFVYPSLWEGFGLPALEALSRGCAVISSNATSLPEVVGNAGLLFDPSSAQDLADKIMMVVDHPEERNRLKRQAPAQAARFSWQKVATSVLRVYEQVAARPQRLPGSPQGSASA